MKEEKETLLFDKYHIYDALIVIGTLLVILALLFFATVFTGFMSMGRASVIIGVLFLIAGGIMIGNGKMIKKNTLGEVDDFYCDYTKKKKPTSEAENNSDID